MKLTIYSLILLLSLSFAQQVTASSLYFKSEEEKVSDLLKELSNSKTDSSRIEVIQDLVYELRDSDPNRGLEYGLEGVELAKKIGWLEGEARCYNNLSVCLPSDSSKYSKALGYDFKALEIYKELKDTLNIAYCYSRIGGLRYLLYKDSISSNVELINKYSLKAVELYKKIKAYKELSRLYYSHYYLYQENDETNKAFESFKDYSFTLQRSLEQQHEVQMDSLRTSMQEEKELEKKKIIETEQGKREHLLLYFSIAIGALLLIIILLVFRLIRHYKKKPSLN